MIHVLVVIKRAFAPRKFAGCTLLNSHVTIESCKEKLIVTIDDLTLDATQSVDIKADIGDVFRSVLHRLGDGFTNPQGESLQMSMEEWPGGRWFRDRGNGIGHLWGHVQVIKPPVLLELSGPLFMSYPALNHIEVKLEQRPGGTHVDLRHRAIGLIDPALRPGMTTGWRHLLDRVAEDCSTRAHVQRS
jgi:hypothetical protein